MPKRILIGTIMSATMQETARVRIDRSTPHRLYGKRFRISKSYLAHNPENTYQTGDVVQMVESRPLSKRKHWVIEGKVERPGQREK